MKKILLVLLAMAFTLTGCFGKSYSNEEKKDILREIGRTEIDDFIDVLEKKGYEEHEESDEDYVAIYYKEVGDDVIVFFMDVDENRMRDSFFAIYIPDEDKNFDYDNEPEVYFGIQDSVYENYFTDGEECQYTNKLSRADLKVKKTDWSEDCESSKSVEKTFTKMSNKLFTELDKLVVVKGSNPNFLILLLNVLLIIGAVAVSIFVKGVNKKNGRIATIALFAIAFLMIILLSYTILPRIFLVILLLLGAGFVFVTEKYSKQDGNNDSSSEGFGKTTENSIEENSKQAVAGDDSVSMTSPLAATTESVKDGVKSVVDGVDSEQLISDVKDASAKAVEKSKDVLDVVKKKGAEGGSKLKGLKIGKKTIIAIVAVVVLLTSIVTYFALAPSTIKFDPFLKNTDFEVSGSEGFGDVETPYSVPTKTVCANLKEEFDYSKSYCEKLIERFDEKKSVEGAAKVKDKDVEIIDALFTLIYKKEATYEVENGGELSNGDKVEVKFVYSEKYAKNNHIKITSDKYEVEIKGLETKLVDSEQLETSDYTDIKEEAYEIVIDEMEDIEFSFGESYSAPNYLGQYISDEEVVTVYVAATVGEGGSIYRENYDSYHDKYVYVYINSTIDFEDGKVEGIETEYETYSTSNTLYENVKSLIDDGDIVYDIVDEAEVKIFSGRDDISDEEYAAIQAHAANLIADANLAQTDEDIVFSDASLTYSIIVKDSRNATEGELVLIYKHQKTYKYTYLDDDVYDIFTYVTYDGIFFDEEGNIASVDVNTQYKSVTDTTMTKEQIIGGYLDDDQVYEDVK